MARPSVAIRLGTEGKAQVKNDFREIGDAGDAAAKRLSATYEAQSAAAERALERAQRTAAKIAAIAPQTSMQMRINDTVGTGFGQHEGSARASAMAFQEIARAEAELEQRTRALLAAIDPVWAAQQRFNAEILEAKTLLDAGRISTEQYAAAELRAKESLEAVAVAQQRTNQTTGLMRAGYQQLGFQVQDITQQMALGISPMVILAQQGGQTAQALTLLGDGMEQTGKKATGLAGKALAFARFMSGPWGAAVTGGALVLGMLIPKLLETSDAVQQATDEMAESARQAEATSAAKEQWGRSVEGLIATLHELEEASRQQVLTARQVADAAYVSAYAAQFAAQMNREETRSLLEKAIAQENFAQKLVDMGTEGASIGLGIQIDRVADLRAQLESLDEAIAKGQSALRDRSVPLIDREVEARLDGVTGATARYEQALGDLRQEFRLGRIDEAEYARERERLQATRDSEIETIRKSSRENDKAAREAAKAARALEALKREAAGFEERFDPAAAAARKLREELERIGVLSQKGIISPETAASWEFLARAQMGAQALADSILPSIEDEAKREEDAAKAHSDRLKRVSELNADQADILTLQQTELSLMGESETVRSRTLRLLELELQLNRDLGPEYAQQIAQLLQRAEAIEANDAKIEMVRNSMAELRDFGREFAETVLDEETWTSWSNAGNAVLDLIKRKFIELALLNPLTNMINGDKALPTLTSIVGLFGGGGGSSRMADVAATVAALPGNAVGTPYWSGGMTWVAENGPELISLPRGSRVTPAAETRRLLASANDNRPVQYVDMRGAIVDRDLWGEVDRISRFHADGAAVRGAAGGSRLAVGEVKRSNRQSLRGW